MPLPEWLSNILIAALRPAADAVFLPRIEPGRTTTDQVRQHLGQPGEVFSEADDKFTWEYSRQPSGVHCYMITFGRDQMVQKLEQVLNEANYARVRPGMNGDEIRRLLGMPGSKVVFDNLGEEIWEWHIESHQPGEESYFMVHFDLTRRAVSKTSRRVAMKG
ncbi:MAG: hypothetical protein D3M94_05775 [Rhodocyclales bacterium GT-UBC]|nr:MAG: hypothetical protein D3M94_05775 [Rhodocyclales bacterium GT-UBC]